MLTNTVLSLTAVPLQARRMSRPFCSNTVIICYQWSTRVQKKAGHRAVWISFRSCSNQTEVTAEVSSLEMMLKGFDGSMLFDLERCRTA